ncbi:CD109 antigen [Eumeta japonica]|uniref:CD109 antigen n=1 Tax=Eumeta variegata TaxID=151549 RepID=A0A4C1W4F1_EUMVA|nr:CD109 antigen [Eumeta japonica]
MTDHAAQSSQASLPETGTRAPQAGPYAFSRLPPPLAPRYYLTVSPQPTWMITNFTLGNDGKGSASRRTPMAAGEWSVGAFALHPTKGLGLAAPRTFTASTPLALTAELPAQLRRGEMLAAVVTVTSTLATDTDVELTFHNTEQYFEFEPLDNEVDSVKKIELYRRLRVRVPAHGSNSTAFLITAARRGEASIIVEAYGNGVSATLYRTIDVKEGYEEDLWTWMLLDARRGIARGNVSLTPRAGTRVQAVSFHVAGDPLVPALQAARRAPAPSADPAHALRPLAVASVLLDYLDVMEYEVSVAEELRAAAAAGYQRLVAYWRPAGYFAADVDGSVGDVWMTALAVRWLTRSAKYVAVSPTVAKAAARWLADAQMPDGSWQPPPVQQRHNQQAQKILPLTAHALLALQKAQGGELLYKDAITRAVEFVARNMSAEEEPYALAVAAAALAAARHPDASRALQLLDRHPNITATSRWWGKPLSGMEWRNPWLRGNSADKATAGWGLRALLAARIIDDSIPVAQYLLSTYHPDDLDPDVLESLSELAEAIKTSTKLRVSVTFQDSEEPRTFSIDNDNAFIMQTLLVRSYRNVSSVTEGRGLSLVGLSAVGRTNVTAPWPRYTLDPRIDNTSTAARLQLSICVGVFVPQGNETISGFTLLTVQLPSGFVADINTLTEMKTADHVSFARLSDGGTRVLAWLRPLAARERCATLAAPRVAPIANQKPGVATLVDLYDSKIDNKTTNAKQWLQSFESECTRFNLNGDTERISALRLFLNDSENDWYGSMLIQHGLDSLWKIWKMTKEIEKQIEQLLKNELIEESYSPFAAPVTLAFKRDEGKKSRLCIDFRDLNKIIIPQPQPFPLIEDLLEHLKHLSKLLDAIAEEGFRLKLTKCKFAAQSVRFLGHIVEGNTITPLKDNLRSIAEFPAPQNKKQIRQFLDHKPLENLNIKNRTDDELGDMTHYLSQYNFVIKYNPGKCNTEADCLSRNPVYESHENEEDKLKTVNIVRIEEILEDQNRNPTLKNKHSFIKENGHHARVFFQPPQTHPCDVCRSWPSCDRTCGASDRQVSPDYAHKDAANVFVLAITLLLTTLHRFV